MFNIKKVQKLLKDTNGLRWFPVVKSSGVVKSSELAAAVAAESGVAEASVNAVLSALQDEIILNLQDSKNVQFGTLGRFIPSILMKEFQAGRTPKYSIDRRASLASYDVYDTDEPDENGNPSLVCKGIVDDMVDFTGFTFAMSLKGEEVMNTGIQLNVYPEGEEEYPFNFRDV